MLEKTTGPARDSAHAGYRFQPAPAQTVSLRSILDALHRRKLPFLACAAVIPLLAVLALRQVTPLYTATGTLIYEPGRYRARELQSILQADPITDAVMLSQVEVLHGLRVIEPMAHRLDLFSNPEFNAALQPPSLLGRLARYFHPFRAPEPAQADAFGPPARSGRNAVLLAAQHATTVRPINGSHVIEVTFTARDPVLAAAAVNGLMDIYIKAQLAAKLSAVDKARAWLERRARELRNELQGQQDRIAAYRAEKGLVQGVHADVGVENVTQLTEALARARADLANAGGHLNANQNRSGGEAPLAPSVVRLREQAAGLAAQLQSLSTRLGPKHPDVLGVQKELREVEQQEQAETARVVAGTGAELRAARERVNALERDLAAAQARVDQSAVAQIPLSLMERDADASRALLTSVLQSLQETAQQAAVETPDAHEVSLALPPEAPSYPHPKPLIAASVASALMLGFFLIYLLEISDTTLASGDEIRVQLGLPCFALIPDLDRRTLGRLRVEDYAALRPHGGFAEQIRILRTALWLGATRPRVVSVTAARPTEGKTTVALSLARIAALSGERVMLLDCDLRRPSIASLLGGGEQPGVTELLSGEARLDDAIKKDPLTPLFYIPAGGITPGAAGLFMSGNMAGLLHELRADYDLVLLDAPPALAIADARVIAHIADATLFCARWRHTPIEVARNAIRLLEDSEARIVGVALTRVNTRTHFLSAYSDAAASGLQLSYFRG